MNLLRAFYCLLGMLLISAAAIKLSSFPSSASLPTTEQPFSFTLLGWLIIPIEISVGCFNIFRKPDRWTRSLNFVLFGLFCCWLGYLMFSGVTRCGCLGKLDVDSGSMLALDFLIVITIVLLGTDSESKTVADRFVFLFPLVLVAAAWAMAPSISETFRQQAMSLNEVAATLVGDPELEIDPLDGFRETVDVLVTNRRPQPVMVASTHCDWCVLTARILDGSVTLQSGETRTIQIELLRPRPTNDEELDQMENDARNGLPVSKVPDQITIRLSLLPEKASVAPSVTVRAKPSKSYATLWGVDK